MSILFGQGPNNQSFDAPTIVAQRDPGNGDMYDVGQKWINTASNEIFFLTSFANGLPVWTGSVSGGAGIFTDLTVNPGPTAITGEFRVLGDVDEAAVIRLQANGGTSETIVIESVQGTGSDSIQINSQAGGIQVTTDGAAGDIAITANLGSVIIGSGEDIPGAVELLVDGGANSTLILTNASGTGVDSVQLNSDLGGVEVLTAAAGKDITIASSAGSIGIVAGEDVLTAIIIQADGGTSSGLLIENTSGTGSGSSTASAIGILATDGAVYLESAGAFNGAIVLDASDAAGGMLLNSGTGGIDQTSTGNITSTTTLGDVDLTADAGDVNIEATLGDINFTTGGSLNWNVTGAINLDATATSHFTVTGAAADLILSSVGGSVFIDSNEAVANSIDINASAGGIDIDAAGAIALASSASDVTVDAVDIILTGSAAAANAIQLTSSNVAGGLDLNAGTGGITIDSTGAFSIDGAAASNVTTTGAGIDLTLSSALGSVIVTASEAAVNAVQLTASDAAGGLDLNAGTGGITLDSTGAISIDAAAASNLTVTGAFDLTVNSTTGSVVITGGEAAVDAVTITAGNAAGGLDLNAGTGGVTIDTTAAFSIDGATTSNVTVTGAAQDLNLFATGGSVNVTATEAAANAVALSAANGGITAVTAAASNFVLTGGNFEAADATKGIILGSGTKVVDGAGSPNASVTAAKGSLYLATNGSGVADRLYINTDGATAWTAITTVS